MSLTDFCDGDSRCPGWTICEMVGNGRNAREVGNAGVCLGVTFCGCEAPCEERDRGEDMTGRDLANVTVDICVQEIRNG